MFEEFAQVSNEPAAVLVECRVGGDPKSESWAGLQKAITG